jgi:uncharacterized protein involved in exopolysaccharide biosynthesis
MTDTPAPPPPRAPEVVDDEATISPFLILNVILRYRRIFLLAAAIGVGGGVLAALLQVPRYEATVRFVTSPGSMRSTAGVGSDMSLVQQRDPFDYYTTLLTSSEVLDAVLLSKRSDGTLIQDSLGVSSDPPGGPGGRRRLAAAEARLDSSTRTRSAGSVPVLFIKASWGDPVMAADLANAFLDALADYDRRIRSSAAKDRREFIGKQVDEKFKSLTTAEEALRKFKEENRLLILADRVPAGRGNTVVVPPQLELRRDQLQRDVTVYAEQYLTLKKAHDQARIAEADEASGLVVIERASPPRQRVGTAPRLYVLAGALLGLLLGGGMATVLEVRRRADLSSPDAQEFTAHLAEVKQDFAQVRAHVTRFIAPDEGASSSSPSEQEPDA